MFLNCYETINYRLISSSDQYMLMDTSKWRSISHGENIGLIFL